jgi:putative DNA primase/helicase
MDTPEGKKAVINTIAPNDNNKKAIRPKQVRHWIYCDRQGNPLVRVGREDYGDGRTPKRWQEHWVSSSELGVSSISCGDAARTELGESQNYELRTKNYELGKWVKGLGDIQREDIPIYKYKEIREAIAQGKTIFIVEGEPCADALWKLGLPATTNIGGAGKWKSSDSKDLVGAKIVLCPDRDKPGIKHTEAIAQDFPDAQWLYAFPNSPYWYNLPASQGLDVADWIESDKLTAADIWEAVEPRRFGLPNPEIPTTPPIAEENYTQKCVSALYSDKPWIALNGKLYSWTGTHYQEADVATEKQRISQWCNTIPVQKGYQITYAYATPSHVENIWKWLLLNKGVSPDQVNPPGLNCLNGVVKIKWDGRHASWQLVPHNPNEIYTYVTEIEFDPKADPSDCDRMLSCLEPSQQQLFIQTIAASLDLATIRKYRGRTVRALLCKGHGNNGKDTLREAVRLLFGIGMSNASVSDFAAYDQGRKFCLSKLEGARINWSSENSSFDSLDRLQSLKAAITGEPLDMERKGVDEHEMMLASVFLFNVNEAPNLKAGMEAIQSRWAVLSFNKTYKLGADPSKGELEADSRFRYDSDFLKEKVCPALLNKVLEAISTLAVEGIDYRCTEEALSSIQQETNHLWAFARDVGLDYLSDGRVYINDLWDILQQWYIDNGTLEIVTTDGSKEKKVWHDQPRRGDKNVKAPNQIYQRFAELFPKIKRQKAEERDKRGQSYLSGIAIREVSRQCRGNVEANVEATTLTQQGCEAIEAISLNSSQIFNWLARLNPEERQATIDEINQVFSQQSNLAKTGSTASHPDLERATASTTGSTTGSTTVSPDRQERDTASSTDSLNSSLLPREESSEQPTDDSEPKAETKQSSSGNCAPKDSKAALQTANCELRTPNSELLIDWVRYQGQVWQVASLDNDILKLRQSGFRKVIHTVHVSQVEIGGYKQ